LAILPGSDAQVLVSGNVIQNNVAKATNPAFDASGGGVYILAGDHIAFNGNIIRANRAEMVGVSAGQGGGGGIYFSGSKANLTNNVIADNLITGQGTGAGIHVFGGELGLLHPTIARNSGGDGSGLTVQQPGLVTLTNGILAGHTYGITVSTGSKATLNGVLWFNNLSGNAAGAGVINLSNQYTGNPSFGADGHHLGPGSAAIDKAINTGLGTDIDGEPRVGLPDLGADEALEFSSYFLPIVTRNHK
jgi:hypothetical protein